MCAPFGDKNPMIAMNRKPFRPSKERRYQEHLESQRQKIEDSGFDFKNSKLAASPIGGLMNAVDQIKFSERDDAKYSSATGMSAARLSNPQVTAPMERQRDFTLNSKNNLETASDYKSKKEGSGSRKKGGGGSLRIKQKPKLNTQNNPQSGLNI